MRTLKIITLLSLTALIWLLAPGAQAEPLQAEASLDLLLLTPGEKVTVTLSISGGQPPFGRTAGVWRWKENGASIERRYTAVLVDGKASFTVPGEGSGYFTISVQDEAGDDVYVKSPMFSTAGAQPRLDAVIILDKPSVTVGEAVTASFTITGGKAPYQVEFALWQTSLRGDFTDTRHADRFVDVAGNSVSFVPWNGTRGYMTLALKDADGWTQQFKSPTFDIVDPTPLQVAIQMDKSALTVGETVHLTCAISGGVGTRVTDYGWAFQDAQKEPKGNISSYSGWPFAASEVKDTYTATPGIAWAQFYISLEDGQGRYRDFRGDPVPVRDPAIESLRYTISLDKSSLEPGESVTASWQKTGGRGDEIVHAWWVQRDALGAERVTPADIPSPLPDSAAVAFTPTMGQEVFLRITCRAGDESEHVFQSPPASLTQPTGTLTLQASLSGTGLVGQQLQINWQAAGGTPPYLVEFMLLLDVGDDRTLPSDGGESREAQGSLPFKLSNAGTLQLRAQLTDAAGNQLPYRKYASKVVQDPSPLEAKVQVDTLQAQVGQPVTASFTVSGGKPPYTLTGKWEVRKADTNWLSWEVKGLSQPGTTSLTPREGVMGLFALTIRDEDGRYKEAVSPTFEITGSGDQASLSATMTLDKTTMKMDERLTASWQVTGGTPPYQAETRLLVYDADTGQMLTGMEGTPVAGQDQATFVPAAEGDGVVKLTITDAQGLRYEVDKEVSIRGRTGLPPQLTAQMILSKQEGMDLAACEYQLLYGTPPLQMQISCRSWLPGTEPAEYRWGKSFEVDAHGKVSISLSTLTDQGQVALKVTDADGRTALWQSEPFPMPPGEAPTPPPVGRRGDADNNQQVNLADLTCMMNHILTKSDVPAFHNADVNGDGNVDMTDLVAVIAMVVGD